MGRRERNPNRPEETLFIRSEIRLAVITTAKARPSGEPNTTSGALQPAGNMRTAPKGSRSLDAGRRARTP